MATTTDKTLFTVHDVAKFMSIGVSTVWRHAQRGIIPQPIKIGHVTRWRKADLESFIEAA